MSEEKKDDHYVFKNRARKNCYLKTTSVAAPGETRMAGPMTEREANRWIDDNCDDTMLCR